MIPYSQRMHDVPCETDLRGDLARLRQQLETQSIGVRRRRRNSGPSCRPCEQRGSAEAGSRLGLNVCCKRLDALGAVGLAHVHRIGVQLTQRKGDAVSHDGSLSLFPRNGLMPVGAGAPLLLPEFARSSGGEGAKGTNRRGSPARGEAEGATQNPPRAIRVDPPLSERQPSGGRTGRPIFPLLGRGGRAFFPPKQTMSIPAKAQPKPVRAPLDRLKGQPQEV